MAVFIDTGVFVAARNRSDVNHGRAVELLREALQGRYGALYTSDYVFSEAVTVALVRTGRPEVAVDVGRFIMSSKRLKILHVDRAAFMKAWGLFNKYVSRGLSFTDATSMALMERYNIGWIMSFDRHFDGIASTIR